MNKGTWIGIIIAIIVLVGGYMIYKNNATSPVEEVTPPAPVTEPAPMPPAAVTPPAVTPPVSTAPSVKTFTVFAENYSFSPAALMAKKGDTVRVTFKSTGGTHDFRIDEFSVASKPLNSGQEEIIEFVANKTGTFEFYCGIGNHRAMGMKGTFIVTN